MNDPIRSLNAAGNIAGIAGAIPMFKFGSYLKKHAVTSEENAAAKSCSGMTGVTIAGTLICIMAIIASFFLAFMSVNDEAVIASLIIFS